MTFGAIVADANVILSAVVGKAALRVLTEHRLCVHATEFNIGEVKEYLPRLGEKYKLDIEELRIQLKILPIQVHPFERYKKIFPKAEKTLENIDQDDAHVLALANTLKIPIWSNDNDLKGHGVDCLPTAKLLKVLENR